MSAARRLAIVGAACSALVACRADAPSPTPTQSTAAVVATVAASAAADACVSPHVIVVPAREPPADATLVMLHGYGASAEDIEPVARALGTASPKLTVLVPDGCEAADGVPGGRQWFQLRGAPENERGARIARGGERAARFVASEIARRGLPAGRVAWAGFSQGAMLSQWMAVHGAPRPIAVVSFSGRFDDTTPPGAPVGTPVLLVHGMKDAVVPFAASDEADKQLTLRGAKVERLDRPGMAHSIDAESRAAGVAFLARALAR